MRIVTSAVAMQRLALRYPDLRILIDHLAVPLGATGEAAFSVRNTATLETDSTVASRMAAKYGIKLVAATPG